MDNGATQCLLGGLDWIVFKRHSKWYDAEGAVGEQKTQHLRLVDAHTTLLDNNGKPFAIGVIHQGLHCPASNQSLMAEDQLEYNNVIVNYRAKIFGGQHH